ncbi:hypothetical protein [Caenispirillum salinarum]|uniref:hypothetical protein n=1 Tax=Caenispirillum salinarum TaxID=859058 RepID=UPI00384B848D
MITPDTLHIRCGSDIREALALGGVPGDYLEFSDPVCQGPLPPGMADSGDALIERRAHFITREYGIPLGEAIRKLKAEWEGLKAARERDSLVLWFEHDLYDQTVLIRVLSWLRRNPPKAGSEVSLVTIHRHPEMEDRFIGLGQLTPTQLAALTETAVPVDAAMLRAASDAWAAFRSPDPEEVQMLAEAGSPHLPFLSAALRRHLQELPWTRDGLSLTERLALRAAAFRPSSDRDLFRAVQEIDPQPFLGDAMFNAVLRRLEVAPRPALRRDDTGRLAPTRQGEALLAGMGDWLDWNPPEHWVGAVDLANDAPPWRWDEDAGSVVR